MPTYCSSTCRTRASRIRANEQHPTARIAPKPVPRMARNVSRDQLAALILEAHALALSFHTASEKADYRYRPACQRIAEAIDAALSAENL